MASVQVQPGSMRHATATWAYCLYAGRQIAAQVSVSTRVSVILPTVTVAALRGILRLRGICLCLSRWSRTKPNMKALPALKLRYV